ARPKANGYPVTVAGLWRIERRKHLLLQQAYSWSHHSCFFKPPVASLLQLRGQLFTARAYDASASKHMHVIGYDVVKKPLIVGYKDDGSFGTSHCIDAIGNDFQRVDVETGIAFVENR